jgi:hypothetical protein
VGEHLFLIEGKTPLDGLLYTGAKGEFRSSQNSKRK